MYFNKMLEVNQCFAGAISNRFEYCYYLYALDILGIQEGKNKIKTTLRSLKQNQLKLLIMDNHYVYLKFIREKICLCIMTGAYLLLCHLNRIKSIKCVLSILYYNILCNK